MRKTLVALLVVPLAAISACGGNGSGPSSSPGSNTPSSSSTPSASASAPSSTSTALGSPAELSGVSISGPIGRQPKVSVAGTLKFAQPAAKTIITGKGPKVTAKDFIALNYSLIKNDGSLLGSTYTGAPLVTELSNSQQLPAFMLKALVGTTVGSRVAVALPSALSVEASQQASSGTPSAQDTSEVVVLDVDKQVTNPTSLPKTVSGKSVSQPADQPQLRLAKGVPSRFTASAKVPAKLKKSSATVVVKGTGARVTSGQIITVQYVPKGKVLQTSFTQPTPAQLVIGKGQVIPCWDKNLIGQRVGSRIVLQCTSADAYGSQGGQGIPKNADLLFSVDILAAD